MNVFKKISDFLNREYKQEIDRAAWDECKRLLTLYNDRAFDAQKKEEIHKTKAQECLSRLDTAKRQIEIWKRKAIHKKQDCQLQMRISDDLYKKFHSIFHACVVSVIITDDFSHTDHWAEELSKLLKESVSEYMKK